MYVIDFHFTTFLFVYIVLLLLTFLVVKIRKKHTRYFLYYMCVIFYYQLLFKVTILPVFVFRPGELERFRKAVNGYVHVVQPIPFRTLIDNVSSTAGWIQLVGNFILLMPIVFIMKYLSKKSYSDKIIVVVCACVSAGIECLQYINVLITHYPSHAVDIDDLILNTIGAVFAVLFLNFIYKRVPGLIDRIRYSMIVKEEE